MKAEKISQEHHTFLSDLEKILGDKKLAKDHFKELLKIEKPLAILIKEMNKIQRSNPEVYLMIAKTTVSAMLAKTGFTEEGRIIILSELITSISVALSFKRAEDMKHQMEDPLEDGDEKTLDEDIDFVGRYVS